MRNHHIRDYIPSNLPIDRLVQTLTPEYEAYLKGRGINADIDFYITDPSAPYPMGIGSDGLSDMDMDELMSIKFSAINKIQ